MRLVGSSSFPFFPFRLFPLSRLSARLMTKRAYSTSPFSFCMQGGRNTQQRHQRPQPDEGKARETIYEVQDIGCWYFDLLSTQRLTCTVDSVNCHGDYHPMEEPLPSPAQGSELPPRSRCEEIYGRVYHVEIPQIHLGRTAEVDECCQNWPVAYSHQEKHETLTTRKPRIYKVT